MLTIEVLWKSSTHGNIQLVDNVSISPPHTHNALTEGRSAVYGYWSENLEVPWKSWMSGQWRISKSHITNKASWTSGAKSHIKILIFDAICQIIKILHGFANLSKKRDFKKFGPTFKIMLKTDIKTHIKNHTECGLL